MNSSPPSGASTKAQQPPSESRLERWIGPRVRRDEMARGRLQFLIPTLLLGSAGLLLVISVFLPYWTLRYQVPQYPEALEVKVYLDHLGGDAHEVEGLRHLVPIEPLPPRGELERSLAVSMVVVVALLAVAAVYIHNRWAALLTLPAVLFPVVLFADLNGWLAAVEGAAAAEPGFVVGGGPGLGWWLAVAAAVSILPGLVFHRRAYRRLARHRG